MGGDFGPYLRQAEQRQQLEKTLVLRRDDTDTRPCIFYWSPFAPAIPAAQFVLLRYTSDGLERVEVGKRTLKAPDVLPITRQCRNLFELQPNGSYRYLASLGSLYDRRLRPDIQDHLGMELRRREPCLFIAGGPHISFTVEEGERIFTSPEPSPPRGPSSRVPGAPILIEKTTVHVIYHSSSKGPGDLTPITFHIINLLGGNLQRQHIEVSPGQHVDFISLQPGESWTRTNRLGLPSDTKVGEAFKYEFTDRVIDWWGWGMKEDHLQTTVKLSCWVKDDVTEPRDNEGRPAIVVPASNVVEFTIV
ncbi:hypothetical protein BDV29DRAFT_183985 [Aspergillus leporis]|uniref:Uncharacterized protein n=1 Tax=Aspergillus leporis TaxID=41062 RepID=A0A5N5WJN4_9EURO|nr:hypothetical protein BDV29DRAFT_183985 [Aspergillus leporis]